MTSSTAPFSAREMHQHLLRLRRHYPELYGCIDIERARNWSCEYENLGPLLDDFGHEGEGGRGESYVRAQSQNFTARARGIGQLLEFIRAGTDSPRKLVVDVLGGDGLVERVAQLLGYTDLALLTCDASPYMVRAAWSAARPALLQRADRLLQRNGSMDGVLVAYGSHHIAPADRFDLVREAHRVLRPGGVLVLHDFLAGSPMDTWFSEVVDKYSQTGHRYQHFTREEIDGYFTAAGFASTRVIDMLDPYTASAATARLAELELGNYLLDMYGLLKAREIFGEHAAEWALDRAKEIFRYATLGEVGEFSLGYDERQQAWVSMLPRVAIVGIGCRHG